MTVGASTGYMESLRGKWPALVAEAASVSSVAAELSAISEPELPVSSSSSRLLPGCPSAM